MLLLFLLGAVVVVVVRHGRRVGVSVGLQEEEEDLSANALKLSGWLLRLLVDSYSKQATCLLQRQHFFLVRLCMCLCVRRYVGGKNETK